MAQLKSTNITGNLAVTGSVLASKIIKLGGTANEILCADGSTTTLSGLGAGTVTSVTVTGNNGLTGTGTVTSTGTITLSHADTSSQASMTTGGRTYINSITLDGYGHVTAIGTGTESNQDLSNYVTKDGVQTISGVKTFTAQPVINTSNGLKFDNGNCKLRIYNTSASPTDYAAIEVRSNSTSTNRNLFIDLANNSLVVGAVSGTQDTTYKVNVKDTFNATTIYENGKSIATQEWVTTQLGSGGSMDLSQYLPLAGNTNSTLMTGSIKYGGVTSEIISFAPADNTWRGGLKYSWSSNTTIGLWGKHQMSQFVWHAGTDFASNDVNGTTTKTYDFQIGRDASGGSPIARLGGKPLATQEWVTGEIPTVNNGKLTLKTSGTGINGSTTTFTANQSSDATFTVTLDSSTAGNRSANKVVLAAAAGQINSDKFAVSSSGTVKATWQYNSSTDCVELAWA